LLRWIISGVIVAGSIAVWTVVPVAWLTVTGAIVSHGAVQFLIVMFGCPLSMAIVGLMLAALEAHRRQLSPAEEPRALLEPMLVVSGVVALTVLIAWWFLVADSPNPSGPLQPI
jgi:hypothetical protein